MTNKEKEIIQWTVLGILIGVIMILSYWLVWRLEQIEQLILEGLCL